MWFAKIIKRVKNLIHFHSIENLWSWYFFVLSVKTWIPDSFREMKIKSSQLGRLRMLWCSDLNIKRVRFYLKQSSRAMIYWLRIKASCCNIKNTTWVIKKKLQRVHFTSFTLWWSWLCFLYLKSRRFWFLKFQVLCSISTLIAVARWLFRKLCNFHRFEVNCRSQNFPINPLRESIDLVCYTFCIQECTSVTLMMILRLNSNDS